MRKKLSHAEIVAILTANTIVMLATIALAYVMLFRELSVNQRRRRGRS